jgi:poly-gamma-glutamate synthesis protein (capsule biosynthesis protein)
VLQLYPLFIAIIISQSVQPRVSFCAVGDVMLDRGIRKQIELHNVDYPFARISDLVSSFDLAFCNLECPISARGASTGKIYCFRADTQFFAGVQNAGFDIFSLANNHTIDWGRIACMDTKELIERASLFGIGAGETQKQAQQAVIVTKNNLKLAFIAAIGPPLEGLVWRKDRPGPSQPTLEELCAEITRIRDSVDFVIVSLHWGVEYQHIPQPQQVLWARRLVDTGADLICGHHPHVLQSIEKYKDRIILYSLGNFVFDQHKLYQRQTGIFSCIFKRGMIDSAQFYPVIIEDMQPHCADSETYVTIHEKLNRISSQFNTRFLDINGQLLITDSLSPISVKTPLLYAGFNHRRIVVSHQCITLKDTLGFVVDTIVHEPGMEIRECCAYKDTAGLYIWMIIGYSGFSYGEYIVQYSLSDKLHGTQWHSPAGAQPWKIMLADINGDDIPEVCAGMHTRTPFSPMSVNQLVIYSWNAKQLLPMWQGSRLEEPFHDFTFRDTDNDGLDEFITFEKKDGYTKTRSYQWIGFGFCEYK